MIILDRQKLEERIITKMKELSDEELCAVAETVLFNRIAEVAGKKFHLSEEFIYYTHNERGDFWCAVENEAGEEIFRISTMEELQDFTDGGFIVNYRDMRGMKKFLIEQGKMKTIDELVEP